MISAYVSSSGTVEKMVLGYIMKPCFLIVKRETPYTAENNRIKQDIATTAGYMTGEY